MHDEEYIKANQELHSFIRCQLKAGRRREEIFVEACHRNGHPEVDIAKAEELFQNYDNRRSNQSFMDHDYRWSNYFRTLICNLFVFRIHGNPQ
jgi:hypothetical protein